MGSTPWDQVDSISLDAGSQLEDVAYDLKTEIYGFSLVVEVQPVRGHGLLAASGISIEIGAHLVAPWGI